MLEKTNQKAGDWEIILRKGLSGDFKKYGIELGRFKTGTPPRILGNTIDFTKTEKQSGDKNPVKFAFYDTRSDEEKFHVEHKSKFHVEQEGDLEAN
jgi:tRNA uridine 5-carboxymethylaminomethyl modification enzyme